MGEEILAEGAEFNICTCQFYLQSEVSFHCLIDAPLLLTILGYPCVKDDSKFLAN